MNGVGFDRTRLANGRAIWGIGLVILGLVLFVDRLGIVDAASVLRFWPLLLVAFGVQQLLSPSARANTGARLLSVNGLAWTIIGGLLLLSSLGILRVSLWQLIWPTLLIFVGAHLMLRSQHSGDGRSGSGADDTSVVAILSGVQRVSDAVPFKGTEITSVMGGTQLDLRRAQLGRGQEAVIDVLLVLGGCELFVPPDWVVSAPMVAVLGGVDDQRLVAPANVVDAADALASPPRLILRGFVMLGGITVR